MREYHRDGAFQAKGSGNAYASCRLCGRDCSVDRFSGERGFCGESQSLRLASASIHRGEEPPVTGEGGSGTIFVTGCTLRCSFCQNWQISRASMGAEADAALFADICLRLESAGAENVNIVTGSHVIPAIAEGLREAKLRGLSVPALWNSSAYERPEALDPASDCLDVFLPDLKTLDASLAARFFGAPDYPELAVSAIDWMVGSKPLRYAPCRKARTEGASADLPEIVVSGTIVRHLVIPGRLESTRAVLALFAERWAGKALLSLMTQYTPVRPDSRADAALPADRYVNGAEYAEVMDMLQEYGIEDGYYQELENGDEWLPDFGRTNPFASDLSVPIWHWKTGFVREKDG
ncbi:MAG: radical SAM protein [Treponema sp. GWB1_62_6]|nr:MAG: radical SAM protein [Treponema sp. GWA1_62_8]OHE64112.1 MAG: radical SAM protein [Treponema sp. GWC1_61_84]OHE67164.1 MAG: radical SAM protein [Treponema sp. GWB1_62_6]HCM26930.1 radical SAM protein [Treponema sp.]